MNFSEGQRVYFWRSKMDPDRTVEPGWDQEITATVRYVDGMESRSEPYYIDSCLPDGVVWLHVNDIETGEEHEIRSDILHGEHEGVGA